MGTLTDKLNKLALTKENIRQALINKGSPLSSNTSFSKYPGYILEYHKIVSHQIIQVPVLPTVDSGVLTILLPSDIEDITRLTVVSSNFRNYKSENDFYLIYDDSTGSEIKLYINYYIVNSTVATGTYIALSGSSNIACQGNVDIDFDIANHILNIYIDPNNNSNLHIPTNTSLNYLDMVVAIQ